LPRSGIAFLSVRDADKPAIVDIGRELANLGFELLATRSTAQALQQAGMTSTIVNKVTDSRPNIVDRIKNDEVNLIINTTEGKQAIADSFAIRRSALQHQVTYTTTVAGARATILALKILNTTDVNCLQDLHKELGKSI
ncbi:MAG: carbamoyl phosphate synthase large subunit, partial [Gammaproteobacteria bacterium]